MAMGVATLIISGLAVLAVVLAILYIIRNKSSTDSTSTLQPTAESFTMGHDIVTTPQGALTGPVIYTNSLMRGDPNTLLKQANETGKVADTSCMVYGASNNMKEFDDALKNQLKIHEIQNKSADKMGFQTIEDLKEISRTARLNKDIKGVFKRDGVGSTKLVIDKYSTIGIIDEKYVPYRDRPKQLRAVGTAIIIPGFDFDNSKALDSNGTGICPKGGVHGAVMDRKTKRIPHMTAGSLNWDNIEKPAEDGEVSKTPTAASVAANGEAVATTPETATTATLEANGIISATTMV